MNFATSMPPAFGEPTRWEKAAATRWGTYVTDLERQVILKGQELAGQPGAALEIGCEGGRWSRLLRDLGWNLTCIDVDADALAACQSKIPDATCLLARPEDTAIPCASASQSLLLCIEVAPVIQSAWFLGEAERVLKKDGIMVGVCWNRNSLRGCAVNLKARMAGEPDIFYRQSYPSFRRRLRETKLTLLHEEGFCWSPFDRESNSPLISSFVFAERALGLKNLPSVSPWVAFIAGKDRR